MSEFCKQGLSSEQLTQFRERGYLGPFTAFSTEEMAEYEQIICQRVLYSPSPHPLYNNLGRHLDSVTAWKLCSEPNIVAKLTSLYGPDLILWDSNIFDKVPAQDNDLREYPWHQDTWYWDIYPMISLGVWLAITPATVENGCVDLIPGSHRHDIPQLQYNDSRLESWFGGRRADPKYFDESTKVPMVLKPGEYFIFAERVLHHSSPNYTQERRIGFSFRATLPLVKADQILPCILLSGKDRVRVNRLAAPPTRDPDCIVPAANLPDASSFSFDKPVVGLGWHGVERSGEDWYRWTGPDTVSWLELGLKDTCDCVLSCTIFFALEPRVLESLEIRVNDQPVALRHQPAGKGVEIRAGVPSYLLEKNQNRVRISFHVVEVMRPCDIEASSTDARQLGLAFHRVSLTPSVKTELP